MQIEKGGFMTKSLRQEYENVLEVMDKYYQSQKQGKSEILKPVCHKNAIMHGYANGNLSEGSIENLFNLIDKFGASEGIKIRTDVISLEETIACVHCCLESPSGRQYSDLFQLLKIDGEWKIISKVFHQYK